MSRRLRHEERHINGKAFALAVLTPIAPGAERALDAYLRMLPTGDASPVAELSAVHFARWVIIDRFPFEGPPNRYRQPTRQQLLFTTVFDKPLGAFLQAMCRRIPEVVDAIWGNCVDYPGPAAASPGAFGRWLCDHAVQTGAFFATYGERTLAEVTHALAVRDEVARFAIEMQDASPAELQAAFDRRLAG